MTRQRQRLARFGEWWVSLSFQLRGYRVIARNLRTPAGEIDLLVRRRSELVVCEVKTRRGDSERVLRREQQRRLVRAAHWVGPRYGRGGVVRIDLVVVRLPAHGLGLPRLESYPAAFGEEVLGER